MRIMALGGLALVLVGIAGLLVLAGEETPASPQGTGVTARGGLWGMMPGWGRMPGHMGGPMGGHMGRRGQGTSSGTAPVAAGAPTLEVVATDFAFRPAQFRVRARQTVNIALPNRGAILHDLTIPALRFQIVAQSGQRPAAALTATAPGTYEFYCSVPGHQEAGMVGQLIVMP